MKRHCTGDDVMAGIESIFIARCYFRRTKIKQLTVFVFCFFKHFPIPIGMRPGVERVTYTAGKPYKCRGQSNTATSDRLKKKKKSINSPRGDTYTSCQATLTAT